MKPALRLALLLFLPLWPGGAGEGALDSGRVARRPHGMVASTSREASEAGAEVLRSGGNAVDAAIATGLALAVTHPAAGNLGGGGFMVLRLPSGQTAALDFREQAPAAAHRDVYLGAKGEPVDEASTVGLRASGVPGTVAGLALAQERWGSRPWAELVEPARALAGRGFILSEALAAELTRSRLLARFPESARVFQNEGRGWMAGQTFVQPDLERTLSRLQSRGAAEFYAGDTARLIARQFSEAGNWITLSDLAAYRPVVRPVLDGKYRGLRILTMPPPSSGGVALLQMLRILESHRIHRLDLDDPHRNHLMVEAMRRAFAVRSEYLGDPDFVQVPVKGLLDPQYLAVLFSSIHPENATPSAMVRAGAPALYESPETTHYSVVDRWGGAAAVTYTLNSAYGSGVTVRDAGFLMNNEMDDFAARPGVPNQFGLVQGERNAIAPGRRPLSSMTPTLALRDDRIWLAAGSPGGPTIINTVLHTLLNTIDGRLGLRAAVDRPRFHHQWLPDEVVWEAGVPEALRRDLARRGHRFAARARSLGDVQAVLVEPATGVRVGVSDRRSPDGGPAGH